MLINVETRIRWRENLRSTIARVSFCAPSLDLTGKDALVDVVNANRLQDLRLDNVTDTRLGHNLVPECVSREGEGGAGTRERTGIDTAAMISLIILGSDIRATPPSRLISDGTRSRA
jgi:hypothetical protein